MVFSSREHVHDAGTRPLLAELHLQYRIVDWLSSYLPSEHIQLTMRQFEIRSGVFMLKPNNC